jgi:lambda family phage tail tape measure protein
MADLTYKVTVDTAQAQQSLAGLKTALGGLAAAFSVRAIVQFGDGITNLQNKLRTLSPNVTDVNKQFAAIAQIADQSRTPLNAVGDLYFRIARAADSLGISQREAATITDTLAKGLASSGMSAQEAAGPLLQLGQALQSGRFQGDELRSILEALPMVAQALAKEMGVPVGRLKELGSQGKITGDVFVSAMRNSREAIVEAFGRTLPTVSQSLERLQTNLATLFVSIGGGQALSTLADAVGNLANAMRPLGEFIRENGEGLATLAKAAASVAAAYLLFAKVIPAVAAAQNALFLALGRAGSAFKLVQNAIIGVVVGLKNFALNLAKAFGIIAGGFTSVQYLVAAFGALFKVLLRFAGIVGIVYAVAEAIDFVVQKLAGFSILDWVVGKFRELGEWLGIVKEKQAETNKATTDAVKELDNQAKKTKEVVQATAEQIYAVEALKQAYRDTAQNQEDNLRISNQLIGASELQKNLVENLRTSYENYLNQRKTLEKEILDATLKGTDEELAKLPLLQRALEELESRYKVNLQTVRDLTQEQERLTAARNLDVFGIQQQQKNADDLIKIQREIADLGLSEIEKKYKDIQYASEDAARAAIRAEEQRRGGIKLSQEEIDAYYRRASEGNEELKRQTRELFERSRSFSAGWNRAFNEYADNATNAARRAEDLFKKATKGMEDAIVNFAKTGKFEWKNFVNMMLEELLRANIQALIGNFGSALSGGMQRGASPGGGSVLGSVLGGVFGGGGNRGSVATPPINGGGNILGDALGWLNKNVFGGFFANGGMLGAGKIGIAGENGPELIAGPASVTPLAGTTVNYYIQAVDAPSFQALVARDPGFIHAVAMQGARQMPMGRR